MAILSYCLNDEAKRILFILWFEADGKEWSCDGAR